MATKLDFRKIGALIELESELFDKTQRVNKYLTEPSYSNDVLYQLELSKIHTLFVALKTFMAINEDYAHCEVTSLMSTWRNLFLEMEEVIKDGEHSNTRWLLGRFDDYSSQHEIVDLFLKDAYQGLKD